MLVAGKGWIITCIELQLSVIRLNSVNGPERKHASECKDCCNRLQGQSECFGDLFLFFLEDP